jgi:multidrug efflux pump subunit AcrA (membrane-fusion protein)
MFARVKLITDERTNIVKIPSSAVVSRFGETFVFTVKRGEKTTVEKRPVTVGIVVDEKAEILRGIAAKDEVVIRGQTLLENGSEVNIVSKADPLSETEKVQ